MCLFYNPKDENVADTVSIYQMYKGAILVARNEYQFGIDGGTLNLTVQTNLEFDIEISDSWIQQVQPTRALTEYNLSFAISKNTEQKDREGTITVKDKNSDKKQTIIVKQSCIDLEREALIALYKATNGDNWTNNTNWCSDKPISEWYGITVQDGELWIDLRSNNLIGELPKEIGVFNRLTHLYLSFNNIIGTIPEGIGNLEDLKILDMTACSFEGSIPKSIGKLQNLERLEVSGNHLSGSIPEEIGNLRKLERLDLFKNNLEGNIPRAIGNLENLKYLDLSDNQLSGSLPQSIGKISKLEYMNIAFNQLSGSIPENIGNLTQIREFNLRSNQLSGPIPQSIECLKNMESFYASDNNLEGTLPEVFADLPLLRGLSLERNRYRGFIPAKLLQCENWKRWQPYWRIIPQQEGNLIIEEALLYASTDYSKDGEVFSLQEHSKGNGIKLVLMGDLFVDTDMKSGGVYENRMQEAMEHYFSIEPFKSLREYFDVVGIKAVSKHNQIDFECAFSSKSTGGSTPVGNFDREKCMRYVQKAIGTNNLDNISTIMVINEVSISAEADLYENGFSIAVCPLNNGDYLQTSQYMVQHEANGHGFGYLLDEYNVGASATPSKDDIEHYTQKYNEYGIYSNIDFTNDLNKIRWAHFINDSRYMDEHIGAYEGTTYWSKGAYRPTKFSIMSSDALFNAPMREAIYKRAMKLAYGDSWTYDYEEFVKFDEPGRAEWINWYGTNTRSVNKKTIKDYKHIPPKIFNYPAVVK